MDLKITGQTYTLKTGVTVLGRGEDADITHAAGHDFLS